jgi:hypothetical protein
MAFFAHVIGKTFVPQFDENEGPGWIRSEGGAGMDHDPGLGMASRAGHDRLVGELGTAIAGENGVFHDQAPNMALVL